VTLHLREEIGAKFRQRCLRINHRSDAQMPHVHDGERVTRKLWAAAPVEPLLPAAAIPAVWVPAPVAQAGHRSDTATAASADATCRPGELQERSAWSSKAFRTR
jgi:hypothetical protein